MSIKPFIELFKRRQLGAALAANALHKPFYKLSFLATLADAGLLQRLHAGPLTFDVSAQSRNVLFVQSRRVPFEAEWGRWWKRTATMGCWR